MKATTRVTLYSLIICVFSFSAWAQTTFTLDPAFNFGSSASPYLGDGSIQPGFLMGTSPVTGLPVYVSGIQPGGSTNFWNPGEIQYDIRATGSTNGFNMRGLTWDAVSGNLIFCDTHSGSGGSATNFPWSAIYVLDANGAIIGALNTNGITGGSYTFVVPGVSDDGVVYVCNQTTASQNNAFKIYRYPTAKTTDPAFSSAPVVSYSGFISNNIGTSGERLGQTMDVRGSGPNTQIIFGSSSLNGTGTNLFLFTTTDGTNFVPHRIAFSNVITTASFNDGIAFGPGNTVFCKQVGKPFLFLTWDATELATGTNQIHGTVISSFAAASVNDALLNISAIAYDPVNKLLAGLEEIGGSATGGRGKVWLYDVADPTNRAPAVLASRIFTPNFQKTTAPMGYVRFSTNGVLYTHASNNGFLVSKVNTVGLSAPTFTTDLPASTRVGDSQTAHFEVFAVYDVTNYQWYSNNVPIAGATTYYYDIPNVSTNMSGVFKVIAYNAAGSATSANSTLSVVSAAQFLNMKPVWAIPATPLNATNIVTSGGGNNTPNERTIAYNAVSNQLLVMRGPNLANLKIMVINNPDSTNVPNLGYSYTLKTTGLVGGSAVFLAGMACADDGAVYACTVNTAPVQTDQSFKIYRWANTDSNTLPVAIFGTNSSANSYNPSADLTGSQLYRWGDVLAARGSGTSTELLLDAQNISKYTSILKPLDSTMTNWTETSYLLQNILGSYGAEAYGTGIGREIQFGSGNTFYQKRFNGAGSPLAKMTYSGGGGLSPLAVANTSPGMFSTGPTAVNPNLNVAVGLTFPGNAPAATTGASSLTYYDVTDPSQAIQLDSEPVPTGNGSAHQNNANAVGQVIFAVNSTTGTNYIFALEGNNGLVAYILAGGAVPAPRLISQPSNLRILQGGNGSITVAANQIVNFSWYKGTNSPVFATNNATLSFNNADLSVAGDYFAVATNRNGAVTSVVAHVSVGLPNDNYSVATLFAKAPQTGAGFYVTSDGGANTPNERSFAYNALSNQLVIVRCPPNSTAYTLWVVDGTTGASLYTMNTSGVLHEGASEVSGSNPIDMVGSAFADDGALYVACTSPNASGGQFGDTNKMLRVYRWTNSAPTTPPVIVWVGDPSGTPPGINYRWGDVLSARGTGMNTEIILNSFESSAVGVLKPSDATLNTFTNGWAADFGPGGSIGRSIQFGPTNTVYEKRKGTSLNLSTYTLTNNGAGFVSQVSYPLSLGGVFVDSAHSLVGGVDFVGSPAAVPDAVSLYDISDPNSPMLLGQVPFAINQQANANVICQTIISGNRLYALDANNGLLALYLVPPANSMKLNITRSGANVNLSWGNASAILQSSPSVSSPVWTDLAGPGVTNSLQPANGNLYYRLIQRL